jgi:hypothetical protein
VTSSEHDDETGFEPEIEIAGDEDDAGFVGGGGPAGTLPEHPGPDEEELHRPDTDHGEL